MTRGFVERADADAAARRSPAHRAVPLTGDGSTHDEAASPAASRAKICAVATMLLVHAAATFALVGLIWTVQLAIYPLFERIEPNTFRVYHEQYTRRIGVVVAPLMAIELFTGIRLMSEVTPGSSMAVEWSAFGLVLVIWGMTAFVSVPLHRKLSARYDVRSVRLLAATNWVRTAAWSLRGVLVAVLVSREFLVDPPA